MRAAAILAALLVAISAAADPAQAPPHRERVPKPKREITIHLDPIIIYRGVQVDGTMIPRPALGGTPLPSTPPPKCKKDRRGESHCVFTY